MADMQQTFLSRTVEIAAPAQLVWSVMADVERWPEWTASVSRIVRLTPGPLAVGSRLRIHQPKLAPATWRVVEVERDRYFVSESVTPGLRVIAHHSIEPVGAKSRVTLSVRFEGLFAVLLARLTRNLNKRYLTMEAVGLKERCESLAVRVGTTSQS